MKPFTLPKFDMDTVVAMHKSNVETLVQAQGVVLEAMQAVAKLQYGFVADYIDNVQALSNGTFDVEKKPEAYMADMKAAAEKVVTVAQTQMDLGMKAQAEALDLLTKRAQANVDELQKFAA